MKQLSLSFVVTAALTAAAAAADRPRIAVVDFSVVGKVEIPQAGKAVAELLLTKFDPEKFQLIERTRLAAILQEKKLTMADVVADPGVLRAKKVKAVRYLVVGSVVKLGDLGISARLVDAGSGEIVQTAEVSADSARGLKAALGDLAKVLQMTPAEKKKHFAGKSTRAQAELNDAYRRALAERSLREANYERIRKLAEAGVASQSEADKAKGEFCLAGAEVMSAKARLDRARGVETDLVDLRLARAEHFRAFAAGELAETHYKRVGEAFKRGAAPAQEMTKARDRRQAARAQFDKACHELVARARAAYERLPADDAGLTDAQKAKLGEITRTIVQVDMLSRVSRTIVGADMTRRRGDVAVRALADKIMARVMRAVRAKRTGATLDPTDADAVARAFVRALAAKDLGKVLILIHPRQRDELRGELAKSGFPPVPADWHVRAKITVDGGEKTAKFEGNVRAIRKLGMRFDKGRWWITD